jgi:ATP-dependent Clp protease ATP-binding subunit ClpB
MFILEHGTEDWEAIEKQVTSALRQHFRPEFLNRVDDVIIFRPLGEAEIEHIIELQLKRLEKLLADRKLQIELTPKAKHFLAKQGYDPALGARPLKRAIQRLIQNPLALAVLEGKFLEGDKIKVDLDENGQLVFTNVPHGASDNPGAGDGAGGDGTGARRPRRAGAGAAG